MLREARSLCRLCHVGCAMVLTINENDRIADIRGDKDNEVSQGYACFKGLQAASAHHGPERLRHSLKRRPDGSYAEIPSEVALDEIAEKIGMIRARDGNDAVALYLGGGGMFSAAAMPMYGSFMAAIGSGSFYSPATLDQPGKGISIGRMGMWLAGAHDMDQADVALLIGTNPLITHQALGFLVNNPTRRLKAAKASGMKLICIDPRKTETAGHADLHLQPYPGEDSAILAGLLRIILTEGWEDSAFCAEHVGEEGMAGVRSAVAPFTPECVESRAGLSPGQLRACAELFARDHKRGPAIMATGGSFAPFANLTQHLVDLLNILCGRLRRPGDRLPINMFAPPGASRAEVMPAMRPWEKVAPSRIRGIGSLYGQKLTPTLAEEILKPGEGQVRALIVAGGNPVAVVPDQQRMATAMRALDLSVTIDPWLTASARLSDYVIAPRLIYERPDFLFSYPGTLFQDCSFARYTPAVIAPPPGSDVVDDWYVFWAIASRLGEQIIYDDKVPLDMAAAPTTEQLLEIRTRGARVTLDELKDYPQGHVFRDHPDTVVAPALPDADARFDVMPADVAAELADYWGNGQRAAVGNRYESERGERTRDESKAFRYLLSSRRSRYVFNSTLNQLPDVVKRRPYGVVYMNPADLEKEGIRSGTAVRLQSDHGRIAVILEADASMRHGVISMIHGSDDFDEKTRTTTNINALIDVERDFGSINVLPRMSAIPVNIVQD